MNRELEFWMPVRGYEGLYDASDWGRIRSLNYNHTGQVRIMKPGKGKNGYNHVGLSKDGKRKNYYVHRLVWTAFVGEIPEEMEIDHIDGCKSNNSLSNLRVVTHKQNQANPITKVRQAESTRKACNKSVVQLDKTTGEVIKRWECAMDAHMELGVAFSNISSCCLGNRKSAGGWKWMFFMPPAVIYNYNLSTILPA